MSELGLEPATFGIGRPVCYPPRHRASTMQLQVDSKKNKTIYDRKSGCGHTCAAKDHERCVVVLKKDV